LIIILIYILLRLFVPVSNYYLEGDEVRHLACAKNFYKLWNKSFYDMHPPFYSWLIRIFKSGVIVSFICSMLLYLVSSKLYDIILTPPQKTIALLFLTFNYTLIYYSNRTFRYQLICLLGTASVYLLLIHNWIAGGAALGLLGLTCTYAGLRGFWIWLILGANPVAWIAYSSVFGSWFLTKALIYDSHKYYPSGIEGKIEQVNPYTWKQLFSPFYFKWTYSQEGKKELKYTWPHNLGGLFGLYKGLWVLLPVALLLCFLGAFSAPWWLNLLTGILLYPSLLKRFNPRNSIIAIPLLGILLAKGISVLIH